MTVDAASDAILGRMVRPLIRELGWSYGEVPDPRAAINYFFPYLQCIGYTKGSTKWAAWFTHYDLGRREKEVLWDKVNERVDLRTVCTERYAAFLSDPTWVITPPIQLDKFTPGDGRVKGLVGTSGFVYPGGRKGERTMVRLITDKRLSHLKFVAAGKGWRTVSTTNYPWDRMQDFYRSLSVYVCTSFIEGTGHGPLEALACGVPVVIPREVGIFDELGNGPAIHRYDVGDYDGLVEAVKAASRSKVLVEEARAAVLEFTEEAWVEGHATVFEKFLSGSLPDTGALPVRVTSNKPVVVHRPGGEGLGVYVVAFGDQARECAVRCVDSWHRHMPGVPVAVASDHPVGNEDVFVKSADEDIGGRSVKTKAYDLTPAEWERVLYVDADTELVAPVWYLFEALLGWDFLICLNAVKFVVASNMRRPDNLDECQETYDLFGTEQLLQYNGGVFGFRRNERTAVLMRAWHKEWEKHGKRDQAALLRALHKYPVRLLTLGIEWNTVTRYYDPDRSAGVLHYPMMARRWTGVIHGRSDSVEAWERAKEFKRQ